MAYEEHKSANDPEKKRHAVMEQAQRHEESRQSGRVLIRFRGMAVGSHEITVDYRLGSLVIRLEIVKPATVPEATFAKPGVQKHSTQNHENERKAVVTNLLRG